MKKILLSILIGFTLVASAQTKFQGSIRAAGSTEANSIKLYLKPNTAFNDKLTGVVFTIQIANSITPVPTLAVTENNLASTFPSYFVEGPFNDGGFYNYRISATSVGAPNTVIALGSELYALKATFSNGPLSAAEVRLANLANGGSNSNLQFYVESAGSGDVTSYTQMFFGSSIIPLVPFVTELLGYQSYQYQSLTGIILPTKFLSFYATKSNDDTKLTWTVDNEENNNYFEVEGSTDGRTFKTIQRVNALKNGRSSNTYSTTDINISRYNVKTVYYRIKQVEADGNVIYSEVRQVSLTDKNFSASLYPNPVKTITKLVIDAPEAMKATILVRDASGKTVQQTSIQLAKGINQQQIDATLFSAGDYNVTIVSDKLNQTIKLTKAN